MKTNLKIRFLLITFILLAAVPLRADDKSVMELSIEQLMEIEVGTVFGACKFEQKVTDAPASVSIVTADEIKKYGYRTLADILRSVRGFYVSYDRNYSFLGARGFSRPSGLSANPRVLALQIIDRNGALFAHYITPGLTPAELFLSSLFVSV